MERYGLTDADCPRGLAVCTVDVVQYKQTSEGFSRAACCDVSDFSIAWVLRNPRRVQPEKVKGRLMLFEVDDKLIRRAGSR